jgi:tetratricopeptide (TPR) repeat protein
MRRFIARSVLCAIPFLFLFAGLATAQSGMLEGRVIGEDGKPLVGGLIILERLDMKGHYTVKTNKRGEWRYIGLPFAKFKVSLEVNKREVDSLTGVQTTLEDPIPIVFDLAEKLQKQKALEAAAANGGTLSAEQARTMSPEQRAELERTLKARYQQLSKQKDLNDAFNRGMEAMKARQYDVAIEAFTKATTLDAKQPVVWAQLGDAYSAQAAQKAGAEQESLIGKAIENYQKAMELKPDEPGYVNNYALALVKVKKIPEAQAALEKAAAMDAPNAGKYYYNLGAVMSNTGQMDAAAGAFKKAIELTPNYAPAQYQYGLMLVGKAQIGADGKIQPLPGTREAFEAYLKLEPNGPYAEQARGLLASFDQSIQTEFSNPDAKKSQKKAPPAKKN